MPSRYGGGRLSNPIGANRARHANGIAFQVVGIAVERLGYLAQGVGGLAFFHFGSEATGQFGSHSNGRNNFMRHEPPNTHRLIVFQP